MNTNWGFVFLEKFSWCSPFKNNILSSLVDFLSKSVINHNFEALMNTTYEKIDFWNFTYHSPGFL